MEAPRVVVSALIERDVKGQRQLFMQRRYKPQTSATYLNTFEIPAGGVEPYENVYDALRREVKEETGLDVIKIIPDDSTGVMENRQGDASMAFRPFFCQQVLSTSGGTPWYGFVFICEVRGEIKMQAEEAKEPQWLSLAEVKQLIEQRPEEIFPLQFATLKKYLQERE